MTPPSTINQSGTDASNWRDFPPMELPRILEVSLAHIVEHGYHATTVRTIAREVGVTVPALYYHFENKQAILVALLDRAMEVVLTHTSEAMRQADDDPAAQLSAIVEALVLYIAHHRDLAFLDSERRSLTPANRDRYFTQRRQIEHRLRDTIVAGTAAKSFSTAHPDECSRAILSMCQGVAGWYQLGGVDGPDEIAERYVSLALATVGYHGS